MPKHKTRNIFYRITYEVNTKHGLLMKFSQSVSYSKNNFIKKLYKKCGLKTSSKPFCVGKELTTTSIGK